MIKIKLTTGFIIKYKGTIKLESDGEFLSIYADYISDIVNNPNWELISLNNIEWIRGM